MTVSIFNYGQLLERMCGLISLKSNKIFNEDLSNVKDAVFD